MGKISKKLRALQSDLVSESDNSSEFEMEEEEEESEEYENDDSGSDSEKDEEVGGDESDNSDQEGDEVDEDEGEEDEDVHKRELQKDVELEELEQEYQNLRDEEQDILKNLKSHKDEDMLKGQAVKNQKVLWDRILEIRILLHKVHSSSNKLPQGLLRTTFLESNEVVSEAYSDLITSSEQTLDSLLQLQEALLDKNPAIKVTNGVKATNSSDTENDKEWLRIQQLHSRIAPWRDSSIDKWHRKTQLTTGEAGFKGKLHAFNQNISEQVAGYMRDPSKRIKAMQLQRSTVGIIGADYDAVHSEEAEESHMVDGDPELLEDSEFYHQLLREFLESVDPITSDEALTRQHAKFIAHKGQIKRKRKEVDRRASKHRKIRFNVHEALVNFMAPERAIIPPEAETLFRNLFGLKNLTTNSAS